MEKVGVMVGFRREDAFCRSKWSVWHSSDCCWVVDGESVHPQLLGY